jgi:hypothetical protein
MLFTKAHLEGIRAGEIEVAFRRWRRPTVKAGGTLTTAIGVLAIDAVDPVEEDELSEQAARQSGFDGLDQLRAELAKRSEGQLYRIRFHLKGPDPRIALRERAELGTTDREDLLMRLERLDRRSPSGPWTRAFLAAIEQGEGVRAGDLTPTVGFEREAFKINVRKLKALGLTESLGTGYRVSPRGRALLESLESSS